MPKLPSRRTRLRQRFVDALVATAKAQRQQRLVGHQCLLHRPAISSARTSATAIETIHGYEAPKRKYPSKKRVIVHIASLLMRMDDTKPMSRPHEERERQARRALRQVEPRRPAIRMRAVGESRAGNERTAVFHRAGCFSRRRGGASRSAPSFAGRRQSRFSARYLRRYGLALTCVKVACGTAIRMPEASASCFDTHAMPSPTANTEARREFHDVPDSYSRSRWPGRGIWGRNAIGRRVSRGPVRAGLPELRLGAHGCAGDGFLPHRRQRHSLARAGPCARRLDHPGPDTSASGRPLPRRPEARLRPHRLDAQLRRAGLGGFARGVQQYRMCTVPATDIALKHVGRSVPNVPLLGGFAAITGVITLASLVAAIRQSFGGTGREERRGRHRGVRERGRSQGEARCFKQTEGSRAVAEAIALCRPQVICAYPIDPANATSSKGSARWSRRAQMATANSVQCRIGFAALSVAIGSSAAGVRTYTATSSQPL